MSTNHAETKNYGKQFFSGVAILAISTFIVKIIGLFYKIPMMIYLGAEGMGYFNSAYDIYSLFFVIATTGIPVAISILVSENNAQGRHENVKRIYKTALTVLSILGLIGTVALCLLHTKLAVWIRNDLAAYSILAISPTLLLICITSAIRGYFQGKQIMLPTAISQIIEALGKLLLGLGFAIIAINKGYPIPTVAAFATLGLTLGIAISLLFLILYKLLYRDKSTPINAKNSFDRYSSIFKKLLQIAVPITISSTILSLTKIIDMTMILGRLNDIGYTQIEANSVYGSYSTMAVSIYNLPSTLVSAIALPLVPMLAAAIEMQDNGKEKSIISSSIKLTALIGFPTGLGISVFAKQILSLIFASQEAEIEYVSPLLSLLGISVFLTSMITITNAILQSYQLVNKPIISMIVGTAVKIITSYYLIGNERVNIYGAPISTFFSVLVIVALNLYFILRRCGKLSSVYELFVKPFISSAIAIVCGIDIHMLLIGILPSSISILATILCVALIYAVCIIILRVINQDEILMLPKGESILKILNKTKMI